MVVRQPVVTASPYHHAFQPHLPQYHEPTYASLAAGYRPLQLPLQPQLHLVEQQQQQQLALAGLHNPNLRHHHAIPHRPRQTRQQTANMAFQQTSDEELAELQKLSNEYEPEVTVGFALRSVLWLLSCGAERVR